VNIAIIGSGYVGLVTGVCLAHIGHNVICVDIDQDKINKLKKGHVPIYEPELETLLKKYLKNKKLSFSTSIKESTKKSTAIFIAVGTPSKKSGDADLTYVENVAREIALSMDSYKLVIEKENQLIKSISDNVNKIPSLQSFIEIFQQQNIDNLVNDTIEEGKRYKQTKQEINRVIKRIKENVKQMTFYEIYNEFYQTFDNFLEAFKDYYGDAKQLLIEIRAAVIFPLWFNKWKPQSC